MIEIFAIAFFVGALLVPLTIIGLTLHHSGAAILASLRGETIAPFGEALPAWVRVSQRPTRDPSSRQPHFARAAA